LGRLLLSGERARLAGYHGCHCTCRHLGVRTGPAFEAPVLATGWFWFLLTLGPVIGLVQVGGQARADRYMYVPMVGLSIMLAWGLAGFLVRRPAMQRWFAGLGVAACLSMAAVTWNQTQYWKDTDTLFQHAIQMDPRNYLAWDYLGRIVMDDAMFPSEAISCFRNALQIRPDYAVSHNNLGAVLIMQDKVGEAIAEYREALRLDPGLTLAHLNLASALRRIGQPREAINEYEIALSEDPSSPARTWLLARYWQTGAISRGSIPSAGSRPAGTDDQVAQVLLGQMLMGTPGHLSDSIAHFNEALRIDPKYAKAHRSLADALLLMKGHQQEAIAHLETAQQVEPDAKRAEQLEQLIQQTRADRPSGHQ